MGSRPISGEHDPFRTPPDPFPALSRSNRTQSQLSLSESPNTRVRERTVSQKADGLARPKVTIRILSSLPSWRRASNRWCSILRCLRHATDSRVRARRGRPLWRKCARTSQVLLQGSVTSNPLILLRCLRADKNDRFWHYAPQVTQSVCAWIKDKGPSEPTKIVLNHQICQAP